MIGQQGQKVDGIEDIRFSSPVLSGNTGVRTEVDGKSDEIPESIDFKTRQHFAWCASAPVMFETRYPAPITRIQLQSHSAIAIVPPGRHSDCESATASAR